MINPKLVMAGGLLLVILSLTTWGFYERSGKLSVEVKLTLLEAKHDEVVKENKRKEVENDERIKTAVTERESLVRQLRDNQVRLSAVQRTLAAGSSERVCYARAGLNAAFGILVSEIRGIASEGDTAIINNKALLDSWPK